MKNLKAVIGLVLVFLLGGICGGVVTHTVDRSRHETFVRRGAEAREEEIVRRLTRKLDLDSRQRTAIAAIVHENHASIRQIRQVCMPQVHAQLEQGQARINEILRPDQREKFRRLIEEHKKRRPLHDAP